jgi:hypothetical protein
MGVLIKPSLPVNEINGERIARRAALDSTALEVHAPALIRRHHAGEP